MKLFYNYSLDCELPPRTPYTEGTERKPFFHGPATWEVAEASVRGFVELMARLGLQRGTSLFVYPDVARHQGKLYRELAGAGVEIAKKTKFLVTFDAFCSTSVNIRVRICGQGVSAHGGAKTLCLNMPAD